MNSDFLLQSTGARRLYETYAKAAPIVDFHNHICVADVAANRRYEDLTQLWLAPDPYKHRLMRVCGVAERYITGSAEPFEKFEKFCEISPYLAGNPVFDWSKMELSSVFGIEKLPCRETARYIFDAARERLASTEYSCGGILRRFHIAYQSPVAQLLDDLSNFDGASCAPSLRGDQLLAPTEDLLARLGDFDAKGCRFADHALDHGFFDSPLQGKRLIRLAGEYAKRGWTLLLHLDAKRQTSQRLAQIAGPAGGYAAVGGSFDTAKLCDLLNEMELAGGLPDTVLFPLNLGDQAPLAVLQGSFSEDGIAAKVQLGPAWWWNDHALGIRNTLNCVASYGAVSQFIGMTTDSRSMSSGGFLNREECPELMVRETEVFSAYFVRLIHDFVYSDYKLDALMICLSGQHEMTEDFSGFRNFFTLNFIAKPIYNAYILASRLQEGLLASDTGNEHIFLLPTKGENGDIAALLSYSSENFKENLPEMEEKVAFDEDISGKTVTLWRIDRETTNPYRLYEKRGIGKPNAEEIRLLQEEGRLKPVKVQSGSESLTLRLTANCTYLITVNGGKP